MSEPIPIPGNPAPPAGDPPKDTPPPAVPHLQNQPPEAPKPAPPKDKPDEPLGENGLKALQAEREARAELEKRLKALEPLTKIAEALGGGDAAKGKSEIEQLTERLSKHEDELNKERMARWRVEAIAGAKLPAEWTVRLSGTTRDELMADAEALAKLVPATEEKRFQGTGDGGVREQGLQPSQLTRADLAGMKPAQIEQARKEGRLNQLMGINP